jgi:hypothetical protein
MMMYPRLDNKARRGANRVLDRDGAFWDVRLAPVVFCWLAAEPLEASLDLLPKLGPEFSGGSRSQGDRLAGWVVDGRPQDRLLSG